jgi:hypothetical protein
VYLDECIGLLATAHVAEISARGPAFYEWEARHLGSKKWTESAWATRKQAIELRHDPFVYPM